MFSSNVVLSPYHNPPYRSPTAEAAGTGPRKNSCRQIKSSGSQDQALEEPKSSSSSIMEKKSGLSPKRKRGNDPTVSSSATAPMSTLQSGRSRQSTPPQHADVSSASNLGYLNEEALLSGFNGDNLATLPASAKASSSSGADSPRTKVASHFQNLHLWRSGDADAHNLSASDAAAAAAGGGVGRPDSRGGLRKRPRWSEDEEPPTPSSEPRTSPGVERGTRGLGLVATTDRTSCVPETPDCRRDTGVASAPLSPASSPSPSPSPSTRHSAHATEDEPSSPHACSANSTTEQDPDPESIPSKKQLQQRKDEDSKHQAHLTWQPFEITGHEIDFASGEDDGEGINGVGFKPTPALAWARQQRRKQQVSDWRAREAREARSRRMERRRGDRVVAGSSGLIERDTGLGNDGHVGGEEEDRGSGGTAKVRMVRFAEAR